MKDWRAYARARDQLYNLVVKFREVEESIPRTNRTPELAKVLEAVARLLNEALEAFKNGEVLGVQIDRYSQAELPGFEEYSAEMKNPYQVDKD